MTEDNICLVVFAQRWELPADAFHLVFAYLVDAQSICKIQRTCRTTRRWSEHKLHELKLDWVYRGVEGVLRREKTKQLRDGSLTKIDLSSNNIDDEGAKAIGEALKVNTSLTSIILDNNEIGDEGAKAIGEALKVNTSLTKMDLYCNNIGDEGGKAIEEALKVNTSCEVYLVE